MSLKQQSLPILILGAGGFAKVILDALLKDQRQVLGFIDPKRGPDPKAIQGLPILGSDDDVFKYNTNDIHLVNALGSIKETEHREQVFATWTKRGYKFTTVVHPTATVAASAQLSEGVLVMAGAVISADTKVGHNSIINTNAVVEHDCMIGNHVHICPGVTIGGHVNVGDGSHIGIGSTIIQCINIGAKCLLGAGAVVISDTEDHSTYLGVPAKRRL